MAGEPVAGADGVEEIECLSVDVRDDQVGLVDGQQGDRLGAVLGRSDEVSVGGQVGRVLCPGQLCGWTCSSSRGCGDHWELIAAIGVEVDWRWSTSKLDRQRVATRIDGQSVARNSDVDAARRAMPARQGALRDEHDVGTSCTPRSASARFAVPMCASTAKRVFRWRVVPRLSCVVRWPIGLASVRGVRRVGQG